MPIKGKKSRSNWSFLWESFKMTWVQFSERTSIHGILYITDEKGTLVTRVFFFVFVASFFVFSNILVSLFWERYKSNPIRMNVESNYEPISDMSFPALTFCSTNLISFKRISEFAKELKYPKNVTEAEFITYSDQLIGFTHKTNYDTYELEILQKVFKFNRYNPEEVMVDLKISCQQLLFRCRWEGVVSNCMNLLKVSTSYNGFCCSFNLAEYDKSEAFVPRHPKYFGPKNGLSVILQPNFDSNAISKLYSAGAQVLVHESTTYPGLTSILKLLPAGHETMVAISTVLTSCSDQVKALPISDRECVFADEYELKYFKGYRDLNCDTECRMDATIAACGCIPYVYPNAQKTPTCNFTKIECLVDNYSKIHGRDSLAACKCLPNCNKFTYTVQTDSVPIYYEGINMTIDPFYKGINESHLIAHVFMGSQVYRKLRRDLLTSLIGLVANFGGIYSLFLGLGILGLIEVFYFLFIQLYRNYKIVKRLDRKKMKNVEIPKIREELLGHM